MSDQRSSFPAAAFFLLLSLLPVFSSSCLAASAHEHEQLQMVLKQLDTLQALAERAEKEEALAAMSGSGQERYRFDYPRLRLDIEAVRAGLKTYLAPSRAQPRELFDLSGSYRLERSAADGDE